MKIKFLLLATLLIVTLAASAQSDRMPTDINPALFYYQAFILAPTLAPADEDYLGKVGVDDWNVPDRAGKLLAGYDNQFDYLRKAAQSKVPCDWGMDWSPGPETLLPQLARSPQFSLQLPSSLPLLARTMPSPRIEVLFPALAALHAKWQP